MNLTTIALPDILGVPRRGSPKGAARDVKRRRQIHANPPGKQETSGLDSEVFCAL